jgi:uncharacterized membrane protein YjgN (DUF898 family)
MVLPLVILAFTTFMPMFAAIRHAAQAGAKPPAFPMGVPAAASLALYVVAFFYASTLIQTTVFNLSVGNMVLDGRHRFESHVRALPLLWIALSNLVLLVATLGLFYPWALVRLRRYMTDRIVLNAASDLDEFTSEVIATQGAIGEEVAAFFDLNIGL